MKRIYEFCWVLRFWPLGVLTAICSQLLLLGFGAIEAPPFVFLVMAVHVLISGLMVFGAYHSLMVTPPKRHIFETGHTYGIAVVKVEEVGGAKDGSERRLLVGCCSCGWNGDPEQGLPEADARAKPMARIAWEQHAITHGAWKP